ncbi:type II toxin-antitoxin system VapB family antitoxin [Novosphingobium sp.]|uniref:type II toxin-antitoxin system VapB family antitoxin n=1 Tax=Novosphingobium sp. TaxID=1874826 RepID=UPI0026319821|nr:type II toxin-antitoxin system VapB family antitoxin [Novosphingobium sp.]
MNAPSRPPARGSGRAAVFKSNRSQAVRIPKDLAFPDSVKQVVVRKQGRSLIITPVNQFWDEFFDQPGIDIQEPAELPYDQRESF